MTGRGSRNMGKLKRPKSTHVLQKTYRRNVADISGDVRLDPSNAAKRDANSDLGRLEPSVVAGSSKKSSSGSSRASKETSKSGPSSSRCMPGPSEAVAGSSKAIPGPSKATAGPSKAMPGPSKPVAVAAGSSNPDTEVFKRPLPPKRFRKAQPNTERLIARGRGSKKDTVETIFKSIKDPLAMDSHQTGGFRFRFPPPLHRVPRKRSEVGDDGSSDEVDLDQPGVMESLEICQGFSKIKLDDWYPFYDFEHHKRFTPETDTATTNSNLNDERTPEQNDDDDEWEETLVYLDLEDIPDVDGLLSSLAPRGANKDTQEGQTLEGLLSHLEMKIFDMDSKLPVLQLGGRFLAGHWEDTIGTSLFFKKKTEADEESAGSSSPHSSSHPPEMTESKLENIVPDPEIPFDPLFGDSAVSGENGYELVGKSCKILKARYFPVVSEVIDQSEVIQDSDEDLDPRDFQIPPHSMVRQHMTKNFNYEKYVRKDMKRRALIHKKWLKGQPKKLKSKGKKKVIVKTEPQEVEQKDDNSDGDFMPILFHQESTSTEPTPSTSGLS